MMEKYDTFWRRFFAGIIDSLIFIPVSILVNIISSHSDIFLQSIAVIIYNASYFIYTVHFHWRTGQTIGKAAMKVRVVDVSETKLLTLRQSFMRDSVYIVLQTAGIIFLIINNVQDGGYLMRERVIRFLDILTMIWIVLEFVSMLSNNRRRAIHDLMAQSVVIRDEYWKPKLTNAENDTTEVTSIS